MKLMVVKKFRDEYSVMISTSSPGARPTVGKGGTGGPGCCSAICAGRLGFCWPGPGPPGKGFCPAPIPGAPAGGRGIACLIGDENAETRARGFERGGGVDVDFGGG